MNRNRNARQSFKGNGGRASCVTRCNVTVTLAGTVSLVAFTLHNRSELRAAAGVEHVLVGRAVPDDRPRARGVRDDVTLADVVGADRRKHLGNERDLIREDRRHARRHRHRHPGAIHGIRARRDGRAKVADDLGHRSEDRVRVDARRGVIPDVDALHEPVPTEDEGVSGRRAGAVHEARADPVPCPVLDSRAHRLHMAADRRGDNRELTGEVDVRHRAPVVGCRRVGDGDERERSEEGDEETFHFNPFATFVAQRGRTNWNNFYNDAIPWDYINCGKPGPCVDPYGDRFPKVSIATDYLPLRHSPSFSLATLSPS